MCLTLRPQDVEFIMVHMLTPDPCWFLGPLSPLPLGVYGERATVTAAKSSVEGFADRPNIPPLLSQPRSWPLLHPDGENRGRRRSRQEAREMSGAGSGSCSVSMTEDILQPCKRL